MKIFCVRHCLFKYPRFSVAVVGYHTKLWLPFAERGYFCLLVKVSHLSGNHHSALYH